MARKAGGLGNNIKDVKNEELLDAAFFKDSKTPEELKAEKDAFILSMDKKKLVGKYFQISSKFNKKIKLYCIEHELKEYEFIDLVLVKFFNEKSE